MLKDVFNRPLLKELLVSSLFVAIFHYLALVFYLYWTTWWFDIFMHFLGGVVIGFLALFVFFTSGYIKHTAEIKNKFVIFLTVLASILVIGLSWELWELFVGFTDSIEDRGDTLLDLVMDVIGASTAFYYSRKKLG